MPWPKRSEGWNNEHFEKWAPFIKDYWTSVQNYYAVNDKKEGAIPNNFHATQRKEKIEQVMTDNFPTLKALKTAFQATPAWSYTSCEIFKGLRNRLEMLTQLFQEQNLLSDQLLKGPLLKALETDSNFLLSSTYLFEQIFELLDTNLVRLHLESLKIPIETDLSRFLALRHHLAHLDPIYECLKFPYYERLSTPLELMAAVCVELNQVYEPAIMKYRPELLSPTELAAIESQPPRDKVK